MGILRRGGMNSKSMISIFILTMIAIVFGIGSDMIADNVRKKCIFPSSCCYGYRGVMLVFIG